MHRFHHLSAGIFVIAFSRTSGTSPAGLQLSMAVNTIDRRNYITALRPLIGAPEPPGPAEGRSSQTRQITVGISGGTIHNATMPSGR